MAVSPTSSGPVDWGSSVMFTMAARGGEGSTQCLVLNNTQSAMIVDPSMILILIKGSILLTVGNER